MKFIYCLLIPFFLFSCKKSGSDLNNRSSSQNDNAGKGNNTTARLNTGFENLTANGNGTYTGSGLLFNSILYRTGTYKTGEAVLSFDASVISQSPLASLETNGPAFVIFYPYITGVNVNFHEDFEKYKAAYNKSLTDGTSSPVLDDYVKDDYTGTYAGSVKKGIVVRDQNSPTTFSIAPGSYQPIIYTSASTGTLMGLGSLDKSGYEFYFFGYESTAYIQDVQAVTLPNYQAVGVSSFFITGTRISQGVYHVTGTVRLANSTVISVDDNLDAF